MVINTILRPPFYSFTPNISQAPSRFNMPLVKGGRLATRSNVSAVQSRHHRSD